MTDPLRPEVVGLPQTSGSAEVMRSAFHEGGKSQFSRWVRVVTKAEDLDVWQLDHEQCFAVCALSGVPLIVQTDKDGSLFFETARAVTIVKVEGKFRVEMDLPKSVPPRVIHKSMDCPGADFPRGAGNNP